MLSYVRVFLVLCLAVIVVPFALYFKHLSNVRASDDFARNHAPMLEGPMGHCTGATVVSPSGHVYTLTAGHCRGLVIADVLVAINEDGKRETLRFIAESPTADLMLLSSNMTSGFHVAPELNTHQAVHTMTHGSHLPAFRTDGEATEETLVSSINFQIENEKDIEHCKGLPKLRIEMFQANPFSMPTFVCVLSVKEILLTAWVIPGSSGGPVLDDDGALVGIVSTTNDHLSGAVPLEDIRDFLRDK